jgi:adenine/guanine/hypoxanthine permease
LNSQLASPDILVFFFGLLVTASLQALRVRGAIIWGIAAATLLALGLLAGLAIAPESIADAPLVAESKLLTTFTGAVHEAWEARFVSLPPSLGPTWLKMDLVRAVSWPMIPFIFIFLFMVLFDTLGTLIGVTEQAGLIKDNKLPRAKQALISDAVGTVAGAALGTSTVTSFIESAAGVEQGGRTGLTALCTAVLFLLALFLSPLIAMVGSYPPITAPALVIVGSMMMRNVVKIDWDNYAEAIPSFLILLGIPLTFSIADGLALGFVAYPIIKLGAGQGRDVKWLMYVMALVLVVYFLRVRVLAG